MLIITSTVDKFQINKIERNKLPQQQSRLRCTYQFVAIQSSSHSSVWSRWPWLILRFPRLPNTERGHVFCIRTTVMYLNTWQDLSTMLGRAEQHQISEQNPPIWQGPGLPQQMSRHSWKVDTVGTFLGTAQWQKLKTYCDIHLCTQNLMVDYQNNSTPRCPSGTSAEHTSIA